MELMRRGALAAGFPEGRIHLVLDEQDAVEATLRLARPGDIAVIMPTNVDAVWGQIKAFTPSAGIQQGEEHGPGRRDKVSPG